MLNADDELCLKMADYTTAKHLCYVTMNPRHPLVREHIRAGARAVVLEEGLNGQQIVLYDNGRHIPLLWTHLIPATLEGRALHNVQNAMVATAVAYSLGKKLEDIRHGLRTFDTSFFQAPGRMNVFNEHPFKVILDYGHNPAAVRAMCQLVERTPVRGRRLVALTMPGDRRDEDIAEVAKIAAETRFDHYVVKRDDNPRGRKPDEVPKLLEAGLLANGVTPAQITMIQDEQEAVQGIMGMAEPNDLRPDLRRQRHPLLEADHLFRPRPGSRRRRALGTGRALAAGRPAAARGSGPAARGCHADPRRARGAPRPRPRGSRLEAPMPEASPQLAWRDSRRLTGPSLLLDGPGAVLEAICPVGREDALIDSWRVQVRTMLGAVGWPEATIASRRFLGGASLAVGAPMDCLYAATLVNEWACEAAAAELAGASLPRLESAAVAIRREIADDRDPALVALAEAAARRGVAFIQGDRRVSVGLGAGSLTWYHDELPDPEQVDWSAVHDVPLILVTGTNGKSTTVRLLAAMARAAGKTAGLSSSDWVRVGDEILDRGDYSGPGGARLALRDPRVEIAVLELARGGILRRGLPVTRADAAIVTNIAADHLGEYGIQDADGIADAKLVVAKALHGGPLILNADDPRLVERSAAANAPLAWFTMAPAHGIRDGAALEDGHARPAPERRLDPGPPGRRGPHRHGRRRPPQPRQRPGRHRRCCRPGPARPRHGRGPAHASAPTRPTIPAAASIARSAASRSWSTSPTTPTVSPPSPTSSPTSPPPAASSCWARPATAPTPRSRPSPPPSGRCAPTGSSSRRWKATCAAASPARSRRCYAPSCPASAHRPTPSPSRTARPPPSAAPSPGRREGDLLVLLSHAARARTLAFLDSLAADDWHPGGTLSRS